MSGAQSQDEPDLIAVALRFVPPPAAEGRRMKATSKADRTPNGWWSARPSSNWSSGWAAASAARPPLGPTR